MEKLPEKCRQAFALHVLMGRTLDEVASELGLSARMVGYYVARGLEVCREVRATWRFGSGS